MSRARHTPLFALLIASASLSAQAPRDASARLTGTITSIADGKPLAGVMVAMPAARVFAVTDSTGRFDLLGLPSGMEAIRITHADGRVREYDVALRPGETKRIAVILDVEALDLAPIVVHAEGMDTRWGMAGFYARRRSTFGRFFSAADIERRRPATLMQMIAGAGVSYGCVGSGCGPVTFSRGRRCLMTLFLNGVPTWGEDVHYLDPADVAGIEVYRNQFTVPREFLVAARLGASGPFGAAFAVPTCGSVVVWEKDWRSRYDADP
jgi:hypothetical protein